MVRRGPRRPGPVQRSVDRTNRKAAIYGSCLGTGNDDMDVATAVADDDPADSVVV